jgi:hypothetical protein
MEREPPPAPEDLVAAACSRVGRAAVALGPLLKKRSSSSSSSSSAPASDAATPIVASAPSSRV